MKAGSQTLASVSYTLDNFGNRTQRVDQLGTHTYGYDNLYRLTSVTYPGPSTDAYTYDAVGNRLTKNASTYTYDAADRLTAVGGMSYAFDNNGNQTGRGSDTFSWDAEDRLSSATVSGTATTFAYNGNGLRDSLTLGVNTTTFTWDVAAGVPQVLDDGAFKYVYGVARIGEVDPGATTHYYLADGLGSVMALVDSAGTVVNTYDYDLFGAVRSSTGSRANAFTFTGEQTDASSGLEYLRARYYDAGTGRFVRKDTLDGISGLPLSQNQYAYALSNPTNLLDPSGLCVFGAPCPKPLKKAGDVFTKGAECVFVNQVGCALEAVNAGISAAGEQLGLDDLGYVDFNVAACLGICVTGGAQLSFGEGFHPYGGGGLGTPNFGGAATVAPGQHISTGWNCGVQFAAGVPGLGPSAVTQFGSYEAQGGDGKEGGAFFEVGAGYGISPLPLNVSVTCYYIF